MSSSTEMPTKRGLNCEEQQEVGSSNVKRGRYASPKKRMSNGSTTSVDSASKKIPKSVIGQLVTKNMYSVNNEAYYLFKFLVDNVPKNYYGNHHMFQTLKMDAVYEIELVYENKSLSIAKVTECKNVDKTVLAKHYVELSDFDGEDTISVLAKLKFGFKILDNDTYKAVFVVNHGNSLDNSCPVQIECMANLKRWAASIKDESITDENSLLEYFNYFQNQVFSLNRIKCQQSNGNFKNFALQNITQISVSKVTDFEIDEDLDNINNISRSNKRIVTGFVDKVNVERQSDERFSISYLLKERDDDEWIRASFYVKNLQNNNNNNSGGNDKKNDKMEKLEKLETDLNQLNDLIENDILKVQIYVAYDYVTKNCNVLGLTKIEIDTDNFEGF
uniref:Late expression factor 3 protein n=1 Tax=Spodoptera frugiperda nuclear polyhedrosis virus TaxID=10455 RepID=A0A0R5RHT0_NPVSF|nr:late expression factor 3 protein [Spodoptera frugiperda multiple nucleopolyhedrovirus]